MPFSTKAILVGASVLAAAHLCQGAHTDSCFEETLEFNEFLTNENQCDLRFKLRTTKVFDSEPSGKCKGTIGGVEYSFKGTTLKISMKCCDGNDQEEEINAAACKLKRDGTEVKVTRKLPLSSRRRLLGSPRAPRGGDRRAGGLKYAAATISSDDPKSTTTYSHPGSSAELTKLWFKGKASLGLGAESHLTHCLSDIGNKCAKDVEGYTNKIKSNPDKVPLKFSGSIKESRRRRLLQTGRGPRC